MTDYEGILFCSDHEGLFCTGCSPKWGHCVRCGQVMCWECFTTAAHHHRGLCSHCAVPRLPDDDLKPGPPSDAKYWAESRR